MEKQGRAVGPIPEVEMVVGKLGRAESPLDPAPVSMIETVINYKAEYLRRDGELLTFKYDPQGTRLFAAPDGTALPAPDGKP